MDLIDNYDDKSVDDVLNDVDDQDFSADELRTIRDYEVDNEDRSTLVPELEDRIDEAEADGDDASTAADEDDADAAADDDAAAADDDADVAAEAETEADADLETEEDRSDPEPSAISPSEADAEELWISPRTASIGEYSFRTLYTPQKVRRTHRVEQALEDGRAVEVDPPDEEA